MTDVQVTQSIQDEEDGIKRLRCEIGDRRVHFIVVPRTETDGWYIGVSVVFRSSWGDPSIPTGFLCHAEEDAGRGYSIGSWLDLTFEGDELSWEEREAVKDAAKEFFAQFLP